MSEVSKEEFTEAIANINKLLESLSKRIDGISISRNSPEERGLNQDGGLGPEEGSAHAAINTEPVETGTDALKDFANWTHASQAILSNGRCSFLHSIYNF